MNETTANPSELRRIADEIRVRIHLAGMEAKDAWARLEPKMQRFERELERGTTEAAHDLDELAATLQKELHKLHARIFKA